MNQQMQMILQQLLQNNPNIQNNPQMREYLNILQNNDAVRGQQVAENLCKTYGLTKEQAIEQAKKFFNF